MASIQAVTSWVGPASSLSPSLVEAGIVEGEQDVGRVLKVQIGWQRELLDELAVALDAPQTPALC